MNELRTTPPRTPPLAPTRWVAVGLIVVAGLAATLAAFTGCASESREPPPPPAPAVAVPPGNREQAAKGPHLPPPESDQIRYDDRSRTLTFYALPAPARWMVLLPGAAFAAPAGPEHRLPEGVDPDRTLVYYSRPGGLQSTPVSLKQIQAAREMHASNLR
jgi:hypothetical protein